MLEFIYQTELTKVGYWSDPVFLIEAALRLPTNPHVSVGQASCGARIYSSDSDCYNVTRDSI